MIKLSIITVNLNNRDGLLRTIDSVSSQTFRNYEHVVVDGNSDDGSVDLIKSRITIDRWISEPDSGVYNAMNKGIKMASGEYIQFLNSGDTLVAPDTLERVFEKYPADVGLIYGDVLRPDSAGSIIHKSAPSQLTLLASYLFQVCHQSIFYHRDIFQRIGLYDEQYKILADQDFTIRCLIAGVTTHYTGLPIANYEGGGISALQRDVAAQEKKRIWESHLPAIVLADYERLKRLESENRRLKRAEEWIEAAKLKPLWFNLALVCKWRWDRLTARNKRSVK